ncbi:MAG TPA: NAD(P)-dependent oxidoreductase [Bacteroidetes bacterium]|nr:NAD(P)-dependent oxidoreductase [Bacteroidota bacterium]
MEFSNKTVFITGATRGIGKAIALKLASAGANIVITGKSDVPHPKLPGTIFTVAEEVEQAGGKALPIKVDVRDEESVKSGIEKAATHFGGIDILVNNASAILLMDTQILPVKRYDLMQQVNARGTFICSKYAIPYLKKGKNPHILTMSPPIDLNPKWFKNHVAYTISKYGMSMTTIGLSEELREYGIAANSLWPKTIIGTAAITYLMGEQGLKMSRKPEIVADAAYEILKKDSKKATGNFYLDEDVLRESGVEDFSKYNYEEGGELMPDLFLT